MIDGAARGRRIETEGPVGDGMEDGRFDSLVKILTISPTRRRVLGLLLGSAFGGLLGVLGAAQAGPGDRKRKRKRRRERRRRNSAGKALYPDLRTLPPSELRFDEVGGDRVLRFTNTIWNAGEGRLELEAPTAPQGNEATELYQNFYDAPVGGTQVDRRQVDGQILYHETHAHYHFADFASYQLLKKDDAGTYQAMGTGTKTSFCITDNDPMEARHLGQYLTCNRERQGLTPGWGDIYPWNLPEQWVDLEDWPVEDGEYGLQSTVDPKGLLDEGGGGREENNTEITYFTVENGEIRNVRDAP